MVIKKHKSNLNLFILSAPPLSLILLAFILDTPKEIISGLHTIIVYPDILLIDYLAIGGIGGTFLNVGLVTLASISIIYFGRLEITGPLIAAIFTVAGFSFIGKNIINTWPIFLGTVLYAKFKCIDFKEISSPSLFATTLSPAVSHMAFGLGLSYFITIPLAIASGIIIGFIIIPLADSMKKFHGGYNLYNIGFTGGIIGTLLTSLLRGFGYNVDYQHNISTEYSSFLAILFSIIFIVFILTGFFLNNSSFKGFKNILKESGKGNIDFVSRFGFGITYINIGVLGLMSIVYVLLVGGTFNGPIIAGVLTVAAFAPFGKHLKNSIPILVGVYIAAKLMVFNPSDTSIIIAALFGTTLAPIAGSFGFIAGIVAGFLHLSIVSNIGIVHGGLNLYNNGFSGGIVAAVMFPILQVIFSMKERNSCKNIDINK